jgi:hypothetical protein
MKTLRKHKKKLSKSKKRYSKKTGIGGGMMVNNKNQEKKGPMVRQSNTQEIFLTDRISTQPCNDSTYREIGIIHLSDSIALNFLRNAATDLFNALGKKGFDNTIYDQLRNNCFLKMNSLIENNINRKICNLRFEIERDETLIYMHSYGTLLEKKPVSQPNNNIENRIIMNRMKNQ